MPEFDDLALLQFTIEVNMFSGLTYSQLTSIVHRVIIKTPIVKGGLNFIVGSCGSSTGPPSSGLWTPSCPYDYYLMGEG